MLLLIFFLVCFFSSVIGAICGIGGGVIIKPVLDSFGIMNAATISFLSGCTVLSMTTYSAIRSKQDKKSYIDQKIEFPLAIGSVLGGLCGKWIFQLLTSSCQDKNLVGAIQSACLLAVTVGTLLYTLFRSEISTHHVKSPALSILIGTFLGFLSSFLGIGGGPINLVVLFYFFSMTTKAAAENSLYIIFFSQTASLISSIVTGTAADFRPSILIVMILGGISGGIVGRALNKKIEEKTVDKLFIGLMIVIICINIYNIYNFTH